jgi:hypothetical protein
VESEEFAWHIPGLVTKLEQLRAEQVVGE